LHLRRSEGDKDNDQALFWFLSLQKKRVTDLTEPHSSSSSSSAALERERDPQNLERENGRRHLRGVRGGVGVGGVWSLWPSRRMRHLHSPPPLRLPRSSLLHLQISLQHCLRH